MDDICGWSRLRSFEDMGILLSQNILGLVRNYQRQSTNLALFSINPSRPAGDQIQSMGAAAGGSLNTSGFSNAIQSGRLPHYQHITHAGTYNENFFDIGPKTKQIVDLHYGLGVSNCDLYDLPKRNFFLSLFLKSSADGEARMRKINACIALDISGSMNSPLKHSAQEQRNRLQLSRDAIMLFFEKLTSDDVFSLVVFHTTARTIIKSDYVRNMDKEEVRKAIYQQFESGGTTLKAGFGQAIKNLTPFCKLSEYEHRVIMLTDVCDNSVQNENQLIEDICNKHNIHTTIIGVSTEFRSETCEKLTNVKGFSYFCAVENSDLQTYLADRFDFTFFPCASNIKIYLQSDQIDSIQVFGSPDSEISYPKEDGDFVITKLSSCFPSELNLNEAKCIETLGGLIQVKFIPKNPEALPDLQLAIRLEYEDLAGAKYQKKYVIKQKAMAEEFYSNSASQQGVQLFYYAETLRRLLKSTGPQPKDEERDFYTQKLKKLKEYCPKSREQELEQVISIVQAK